MPLRTRVLSTVVVLLALVCQATPSQAAAASLGPDDLLRHAAALAEDTRRDGPLWVDTPDVDVLFDSTRYLVTRAHDFGGWLHLFVKAAPGRVAIGFWRVHEDGAMSGTVAALDITSLEIDNATPFSVPAAAASAPGDDLMQAEEEACQTGLDALAALIDCGLTRECTPIPGPVGVFTALVGPISCRATVGKGLTWWSGFPYDAQTQDNWGPRTRGYTERMDIIYVSQGCAPDETVRAWDDTTAGSLRHGECYDFRSQFGPTKRPNVTYTLDIFWADGIRETRRHDTTLTKLIDLHYHYDNLYPGTYLMHVDMTESLAPNQFAGRHRFGRVFREYTFRWCNQYSGTCG